MANFEKGIIHEFPIHEVMERLGINPVVTEWRNYFDGMSLIDACKVMDYQANQLIQPKHTEYNIAPFS